MLIETRSTDLTKLLTANSTVADASISEPAWTATQPATGPTTGVIDMSLTGQSSANALKFFPFGAGVATNTFLLSVFGWDLVHPRLTQHSGIWISWLLASFTCTLNTVAGVPGTEVDENQLACGTIALVVGNANVSNEILSPTGNLVASILLDTQGAKLVQPKFATNGSATSANTLYRKV